MEKTRDQNKYFTHLIFLFIVVLVLIIGTSYAIWQLTFRQTDKNTITTGCFKLEFKDQNPISLSNAYPMTNEDAKKLVPYEFTLTNICEKQVDYYVNLETLTTDNPLRENYLRASLTTDNKDVFSDTLKDEYINTEKVIKDATKAFMINSGTLLEKETKTFYLRLWLDVDTPLSTDTINKTYQGKVTVTTTYVPDLVVRNMMIPMDTTKSFNEPTKNNTYTKNGKYQLSKISFEKTITNYENATEVVDFSIDGDKSVQGYYVKDNEELDDSKYTLHIQANGKIQVNPNGYAYFSMPDDSETVFEGIENIDTSFVESMSFMFCKYNGETLDLSGFNTKNVTDMQNMFFYCKNLINLDLTSFDTSKVVNMTGMFLGCNKLTDLNLKHFDTSSVTSMAQMFQDCEKLVNLVISNFDTSHVTSMYCMFFWCESLASLDINNFDTSSVTNMQAMFSTCKKLTSLDLSGFDTSNVTIMASMFSKCWQLTSLNLSNFATSKVTDMFSMFSECSRLTSLDLKSFDTSHVTSMASMFERCNILTSLNITNFDTSKVTTMSHMFEGCNNLDTLDLNNFDTSKVTNMQSMFARCYNLTTIITIRNTQTLSYSEMFSESANKENAQITVNYTSETSDLVDKMIGTKSSDSNVIKGTLVS